MELIGVTDEEEQLRRECLQSLSGVRREPSSELRPAFQQEAPRGSQEGNLMDRMGKMLRRVERVVEKANVSRLPEGLTGPNRRQAERCVALEGQIQGILEAAGDYPPDWARVELLGEGALKEIQIQKKLFILAASPTVGDWETVLVLDSMGCIKEGEEMPTLQDILSAKQLVQARSQRGGGQQQQQASLDPPLFRGQRLPGPRPQTQKGPCHYCFQYGHFYKQCPHNIMAQSTPGFSGYAGGGPGVFPSFGGNQGFANRPPVAYANQQAFIGAPVQGQRAITAGPGTGDGLGQQSAMQ